MTRQDFFRLPIGTHKLTDNINNYHYSMLTKLTEDGERMHIIKENLSGGTLCLFEEFVTEEGNVTFYPGDIKYKIISVMAGIGGLTVHSNNSYSLLSKLRFIPRGSFEKFVELTENL